MSEQITFEVKLDEYDGPIDLLLHLVKKKELPIEKVSLAQVANQYLSCLDQLANLDFDLAGEYLVIAATLISIKSSVLLGTPKDDLLLNLTEEGPDPHEELLLKLKEAAIYRSGATKLGGISLLGVDVFSSQPTKTTAASAVVFKNHDPHLLGKALQKLIDKAKERGQEYVVTVDSISIAQRMVSVVDKLKKFGAKSSSFGVSFESLFEDDMSVSSIISTFLALLELSKRAVIDIVQQDWCQDITVCMLGESSGVGNGEVIYDQIEYA